ncbi:hypothetical protein Tco_0604322 [Tanacetum coccineum]
MGRFRFLTLYGCVAVSLRCGLRNTVGSGAGGGSLGGGSGEGAFVVSRGEVVTVSGFGTAVVVVVETRLSEDVGLWGMVHWWLVVGSGGKLLGDKIAGVVWALDACYGSTVIRRSIGL